jgi:hypothetical protein
MTPPVPRRSSLVLDFIPRVTPVIYTVTVMKRGKDVRSSRGESLDPSAPHEVPALMFTMVEQSPGAFKLRFVCNEDLIRSLGAQGCAPDFSRRRGRALCGFSQEARKRFPPESTLKRTSYKLVPDLVPRPLWGISAPRALKKSADWKAIRKETLAEVGDKCQFCDADARLECHDKWEYDDKECVATLVGFEIRCKACHFVTHIGRAMQLGLLHEAAGHLRKVNGCTERDVDLMVAAAMSSWKKRNQKRWTVVVAPALLKRYPRLQEVPLMASTPMLD